ncbi:MAG: FMN-binding negative transcriptional regulator [Saprospiraceae bacterium]
MYVPKHFEQKDLPALKQFIFDHPFGLLISQHDGHPMGSHIPLDLVVDPNQNWIITGHLARANDQSSGLEEGQTALAIFQGAHHYISSQWYQHMSVPTWNFMAVHLSGKIHLQNPEETRASIQKMMQRYEPEGKSPVSLDKVPEEMLNRLYRGVQGFELRVETIQGKWKLSQNKDEESAQQVIRELESIATDESMGVAEAMRKTRS